MLNTEAHPFPRFDPSTKQFKTGWKRLPRDAQGNLLEEKTEKEGGKVEGEPQVVKKVLTQLVTKEVLVTKTTGKR